ncbi:hypothetical protein IAR55_001161 [Kwoniella newhampshirensis]|uniref:Uncharacterized protein n=1 Tax=Kwoniella newhampshirensis TaxID=1651941 RepID=A0AAW0Z506_9TREE
MSLLPQYRKDMTDSESVPLFMDEHDEHDPSPAYPPRLGADGPSDGSHNVTYTFVPRWPVLGEQQDALGVLGRTKEETISRVQRGFPQLADYPPNRIEFLVPVPPLAGAEDTTFTNNNTLNNNNNNDRWGRVMDEAWPGFQASPPTRLRVQVVDGPGDLEGRKAIERRKALRNNLIVIACIFSPIWLIGGGSSILWLCGII